MWNDELMRDNEAAWQRLEAASGIDRDRWQMARPQDAEAVELLRTDPAVRAALDEVKRSILDVGAWGQAKADGILANLEILQQQVEDEKPGQQR